MHFGVGKLGSDWHPGSMSNVYIYLHFCVTDE